MLLISNSAEQLSCFFSSVGIAGWLMNVQHLVELRKD